LPSSRFNGQGRPRRLPSRGSGTDTGTKGSASKGNATPARPSDRRTIANPSSGSIVCPNPKASPSPASFLGPLIGPGDRDAKEAKSPEGAGADGGGYAESSTDPGSPRVPSVPPASRARAANETAAGRPRTAPGSGKGPVGCSSCAGALATIDARRELLKDLFAEEQAAYGKGLAPCTHEMMVACVQKMHDLCPDQEECEETDCECRFVDDSGAEYEPEEQERLRKSQKQADEQKEAAKEAKDKEAKEAKEAGGGGGGGGNAVMDFVAGVADALESVVEVVAGWFGFGEAETPEGGAEGGYAPSPDTKKPKSPEAVEGSGSGSGSGRGRSAGSKSKPTRKPAAGPGLPERQGGDADGCSSCAGALATIKKQGEATSKKQEAAHARCLYRGAVATLGQAKVDAEITKNGKPLTGRALLSHLAFLCGQAKAHGRGTAAEVDEAGRKPKGAPPKRKEKTPDGAVEEGKSRASGEPVFVEGPDGTRRIPPGDDPILIACTPGHDHNDPESTPPPKLYVVDPGSGELLELVVSEKKKASIWAELKAGSKPRLGHLPVKPLESKADWARALHGWLTCHFDGPSEAMRALAKEMLEWAEAAGELAWEAFEGTTQMIAVLLGLLIRERWDSPAAKVFRAALEKLTGKKIATPEDLAGIMLDRIAGMDLSNLTSLERWFVGQAAVFLTALSMPGETVGALWEGVKETPEHLKSVVERAAEGDKKALLELATILINLARAISRTAPKTLKKLGESVKKLRDKVKRGSTRADDGSVSVTPDGGRGGDRGRSAGPEGTESTRGRSSAGKGRPARRADGGDPKAAPGSGGRGKKRRARNHDTEYHEVLQTSKGPVELDAQLLVEGAEGKTIHLSDVNVFPVGAMRRSPGASEVLRVLRKQIGPKFKAQGFERMRVTGVRITGAKKASGKADRGVDFVLDL